MVTIKHVPLLQAQRDLMDTDRGFQRFREYIDTMVAEGGDEPIELPLSGFNPMSRDHVRDRLDAYLRLDAEDVAERASRAAAQRLGAVDSALRVGLVLADDARGGWTNRTTTEMSSRFDTRYEVRHGWVVTLLWSSDPASATEVRESVMAQIFRVLHIRRHGPARSLREHLAQEGRALAFAGSPRPALDPDDLAYSREAIEPYLDTDAFPVIVACLYGDDAARELGYRPEGLTAGAGFAVAVADAIAGGIAPERFLEPE